MFNISLKKLDYKEFFTLLDNLQRIDEELGRFWDDFAEFGDTMHVRHIFLYYIYYKYVRFDSALVYHMGQILSSFYAKKYSQDTNFYDISNEHLFEKSFSIVAHIDSKEIGNISNVYGDIRNILDVGESDLIGDNVKHWMPDIISRHHSAIMKGYTRDIEKTILHRYIDSYLCSKSKLVIPVTGLFKYLPLYTISEGILLCTYWKLRNTAD